MKTITLTSQYRSAFSSQTAPNRDEIVKANQNSLTEFLKEMGYEIKWVDTNSWGDDSMRLVMKDGKDVWIETTFGKTYFLMKGKSRTRYITADKVQISYGKIYSEADLGDKIKKVLDRYIKDYDDDNTDANNRDQNKNMAVAIAKKFLGEENHNLSGEFGVNSLMNPCHIEVAFSENGIAIRFRFVKALNNFVQYSVNNKLEISYSLNISNNTLERYTMLNGKIGEIHNGLGVLENDMMTVVGYVKELTPMVELAVKNSYAEATA